MQTTGNLSINRGEVLAIADYMSQGKNQVAHTNTSPNTARPPWPSAPCFCLPGDSNKRAGRAGATIKSSTDLINLPM